MKASKDKEVRFESSVRLFQFCKTMLAHKRGTTKVIDQDVGQILAFDPADCSHWKNGKKQIKSIFAMRSIAQQLDVDESIVSSIAFGELDTDEAIQECTTYEKLFFDQSFLDQERKEFFKNNPAAGSHGDAAEMFQKQFDLHTKKIIQLVADIHAAIDFKESPLFLPQLLQAYPVIQLGFNDKTTAVSSHWSADGKKLSIECSETRMNKTITRFLIAKECAEYFFKEHGLTAQVNAKTLERMKSQFAAELLAPQSLIRSEAKKLDPKRNLVVQLAEAFWVSPRVIQLQLQAMV
jgi:hypothetical protein